MVRPSERLETRGLTKRFGEFTAVSDVTLSFDPGLIHAVLGENGAGKSTLMKLLFGLHRPTSGEVVLSGKPLELRSSLDAIRHGLGMVQQHFTLVETLSAIDNIMLGAETTRFGQLDRAAAVTRLESLLPTRSLSVPWYKAVSELTVGERQRVEILKLLFRESNILILDEPTAVLTPFEIAEFFDVLRALKSQGRSIILITHKLNEVLQVCDTYSILRHGKVTARGEVATASVDSLVEAMIGRKLPEFIYDRTTAQQTRVLECQELEVGGGSPGVSLQLRAGEIVGIAGVEGSGQSLLVDTIMGLRRVQGRVTVFGRPVQKGETNEVRALGVGLIPEDRLAQGLWLEESCVNNMVIGLEGDFTSYGIFQNGKLEAKSKEWARDFDVRSANLDVPVGALSGGNQQKVLFAREVNGRKPRLLICHQPTRGVDLGAIDLIHRRIMELRADGLGVLLISSELDELLKLSDRLYVFFNGRVSAEFERADFDRGRIGAAMTGVQS